MSKTIDVVFDDGPGPVAGRFVEVEQDGRSIGFGEWIDSGDGFWRLRFPDPRELEKENEQMRYLLKAMSVPSAYQAERTGGVVQGCPRGPRPSPETLATRVKLALSQILGESEEQSIEEIVEDNSPIEESEERGLG